MTVTTSADELDPLAAQNGDCSLREAVFAIDQGSDYLGTGADCVSAVNPYGTNDTVVLGPGTYELTRPAVAGPDGNEDGDLDIFNSITIQGAGDGPGGTLIDTNGIDRTIDVRPIGTRLDLTVKDLTIANGNSAGDGGAIRIGDPDAAVRVATTTIRNSHSGGDGGGIAFRNAAFGGLSSFEIDATELIGNTAVGSGGGFHLDGATFTLAYVTRSTFAGNHAASGGALYVKGEPPNNNLFLQNSTLSGNSASVSGGAIELEGAGTLGKLAFSTVVGNTTAAAGGGGGVHGSGPAGTDFLSSILSANTAAGAPSNCAGATTLYDGGWNIESADTCGLGTGAPGFNLVNTDSRLAPLADNGGDTRTHGLYDGSPALDHANCGSSDGSDQRYAPRPGNRGDVSGCDTGAFEGSVGPAPTPPAAGGATTATTPAAAAEATKKKCKKKRKRAAAAKKKCRKKK